MKHLAMLLTCLILLTYFRTGGQRKLLPVYGTSYDPSTVVTS